MQHKFAVGKFKKGKFKYTVVYKPNIQIQKICNQIQTLPKVFEKILIQKLNFDLVFKVLTQLLSLVS